MTHHTTYNPNRMAFRPMANLKLEAAWDGAHSMVYSYDNTIVDKQTLPVATREAARAAAREWFEAYGNKKRGQG